MCQQKKYNKRHNQTTVFNTAFTLWNHGIMQLIHRDTMIAVENCDLDLYLKN